MVNTKSLTCDLEEEAGSPGRTGWTVWRGDSLESLAGVRRKWAHPIGFTTKVILTLVNLQEFMFENPSGDVRRDRAVVFYMNTREIAHSKTGYHKTTETEIILKISPSYAHAFPL